MTPSPGSLNQANAHTLGGAARARGGSSLHPHYMQYDLNDNQREILYLHRYSRIYLVSLLPLYPFLKASILAFQLQTIQTSCSSAVDIFDSVRSLSKDSKKTTHFNGWMNCGLK